MLLFFLSFVAVLFFGVQTKPKLQYDSSCFARERTSALNGFFVLLVFLSHVATYVQPSGVLDSAYLFLKSQLDQLVVAPFLFFSGYGVFCAIRDGGASYIKRFPMRRLGKVLLRSEAGVLLFLVTAFCIRKRFSLQRILLAFTFWENIGNSNWYLFVVLALYVIVFVSFLIAHGRLALGTTLVSALSVALVLVLRFAGKEPWWYNTLLLFPFGMWFALCKPRLEGMIFCSKAKTAAAFAGCCALFCVAHLRRGAGFVWYELWAAAFMGCVVLAITRLHFENAVLRFFGRHVFSVFLLQRIPMIVFARLGLSDMRYLYIMLCFAATVLLAVGFDAVFTRRKRSSA